MTVLPLPVMRPKLPSAERLLPYLSKIDQSRIYSNYGPLSSRLECRLGKRYGLDARCVTTAVNGTLGLTLTLLALNAKPGTLCILPAWTFVASALAIIRAGLVPYFVDVNAETWSLDPLTARAAVADAPAEVGAVMPVAPFGQPIDFAGWDDFRRSTGLPVVTDAAAAFDSVEAVETPAVVSLHATKAFGVGEGAFIVSTDPGVIKAIRVRANFGFDGTRDSAYSALNGKMSEYHAAVGNAALDEWETARAEWFTAAAHYRRLLIQTKSIRPQRGFGESWISSVCVLDVGGMDAGTYEENLRQARVETRRWWGNGAHMHPSTLHLPRTLVSATERLAESTLAVPLFRDMHPSDIEYIVGALTSRIADRQSSRLHR
jgi:dTDP-4-amino-4,6-dideoxygalactose transaminase